MSRELMQRFINSLDPEVQSFYQQLGNDADRIFFERYVRTKDNAALAKIGTLQGLSEVWGED